MALSDIRTFVTDKLRETAGLVTPEQKDRAIQEVITDYSRRVRPLHRVQTLTGDGLLFDFTAPSDFMEGFSALDQVEYPTAAQDPTYLDGDDFFLYRDTAGVLKLRLRSLILGVGETAHVHYTTRHVINDSGPDTVPLSDRQLIAAKATAILLRQLAAYAAQTTQATLGADSVDRLQQVDKYLQLAAEYEKDYARAFGIQSGIAAASAIKDLDVELSEGQGARLFHSPRFR